MSLPSDSPLDRLPEPPEWHELERQVAQILAPEQRQRVQRVFSVRFLFLAVMLVLTLGTSLLTFVLVSQIFSELTPALQRDLEWKAVRGAAELASRCELGIVLADEALIRQEVADYLAHDDVEAIVVADANGTTIAHYGPRTESNRELFSGPEQRVRPTKGSMVSWASASIEGGEVGRVAIVVSGARLQAGQALKQRVVMVGAAGGLVALGLGVFFIVVYVGPMVRFTREAFLGLEQTLAAALAALRTSRTKSDFIATTSHEIRTPMNGVLGMLEVLLRSELTDKQRRQAKTARESAKALLQVINDVLDFSKIEAGKLDIRAQDVEPRILVEDVVEVLRQRAEEKGLVIEQTVDPQVPQTVHIDGLRVRQILLNLLGNAVKFTQQGQVSLVLRLVCGKLRFKVSDTGPGIPEHELPGLFEAYSQRGNGGVSVEGTGLGLAISRQLAELLGGEVTVRSVLGEGSSFFVELPYAEATGSSLLKSSQPPHGLPGKGGVEWVFPEGTRVLVADDNPINREVLQTLLAEIGVEADLVDDGAAAVASVREQHYDAVLMDCQMPNVDGYAATQLIRAEETERRVPVIAVTAAAMAGDRQRAIDAGMDDHLSKPVELRELSLMLKRWVEPVEAPRAASVGARAQERSPRGPGPGPSLPPISAAVAALVRKHLPGQLQELVEAVDRQGEEAAPLAHKLRGSVGMIGAESAAELCSQVERSVGSKDWDGLPKTVAALRSEVAHLLEKLPPANS